MIYEKLEDLKENVHKALECHDGKSHRIKDAAAWRGTLTDNVVQTAVFAADLAVRGRARFVLKNAAKASGIELASIHDLYSAMGRGEAGGFTVPAMNLRGLSYDTARAFFRAAKKTECGAFIFEIAKSEMQYTSQRPHEYVAVMLAAALREGFSGPLFIQGDHFQASAKGYFAEAAKELDSLKKLIRESISAGFYNIDIDSSTLVVLERPDVPSQQRDNAEVCAALTAFIRENEPEGAPVSVGGEIGEVGGHNSTVEEFLAFMAEYQKALGQKTGIRKISVQTGTSHGGVVLPDGSIAKVKLDFDVLSAISKAARERFGMGGTVQHGASTLPDELFHKFPENGACEVHLATGFQNMVYDHPALPADFREHVYGHLRSACAKERKEGETEEQFLYKTRKKGFGDPLKKEWWSLPEHARGEIGQALEKKFAFLIEQLAVKGSQSAVAKFVHPAPAGPDLAAEVAALGGTVELKPDDNPRAD
jgi:fructose/tagatose bisphosphate aldolase